jgi:hypothetical protein
MKVMHVILKVEECVPCGEPPTAQRCYHVAYQIVAIMFMGQVQETGC